MRVPLEVRLRVTAALGDRDAAADAATDRERVAVFDAGRRVNELVSELDSDEVPVTDSEAEEDPELDDVSLDEREELEVCEGELVSDAEDEDELEAVCDDDGEAKMEGVAICELLEVPVDLLLDVTEEEEDAKPLTELEGVDICELPEVPDALLLEVPEEEEKAVAVHVGPSDELAGVRDTVVVAVAK